MFKKLFYLISIVSLMAVSTQVQADVIFSDDFDHAMMDDWSRINYQGWYEQEVLEWPSPGGPWVIGNWDGYQSLPDDSGVSPTVLAYNYINTFNAGMGEPNLPQAWTPGYEGEVFNGVLRITATNSAWEHGRNSGPFLYKMVEGDFVAQVEIVAYDYWYHDMGGLMARDPNPDPNENWTQVCIFPLWGAGNRVNDTTEGETSWLGTKGFPCDSYLRLQRVGNTFSYYTSPDGVTYSSLMTLSDPDDPNSPMIPLVVDRPDLPAELQVGIFQSNFTPDWQASMDFDNFIIETAPTAGLAGLVTKANAMAGFDQAIVDRLASLGYTVTIIDSGDVKSGAFSVADAEALDVIIVSEVISSSDANPLAGANVPIMNGEGYGWQKVNYAEDDGSQGWKLVNDPNGNLVTIIDDSHPIVVDANLTAGPIVYF